MGILLAIVRAVVLIGAVCFSFALMGFGFHVVIREYKMLRTRKQIEEFLRMTNETGFQADAAKGTISLNRTRPGIILVAIGAVLLMVCVFQNFQYESASQQTGEQAVSLPTRAERNATQTPSFPSPSLTPPSSPTGTPQQSAQTVGITPMILPYPFSSGSRSATSQLPGNSTTTAASPKITVETVERLRLETLDKWLSDANSLIGKSLGEQAEWLRSKYGDAAVGFDSIMLDKPTTVREIAEMAYGSPKYESLLRMSNPTLPQGDTPVPSYKNVRFLQPLLALATPATSSTRTLMRITAGESKSQLYDRLLGFAESAMQSSEYKADPAAWWQKRGGLAEFEQGLSNSMNRKWAMQYYKPEENESLETVAKIYYGSARFVPLLMFFNYDQPSIFVNVKSKLPRDTNLVVLYLSEM